MAAPAVIEKGGLELLVDLERNGAISAIGLHLSDPNLTEERAEAIGFLLGRMHQSLRFAMGDWLLLIEALFPEHWTQMSEVLGLSEEGRKEYMRVSERVPRSIRRKEEWVTWSHHRAVAALTTTARNGERVTDHKAQRAWLKRVADEGLSHHALRDALREESGAASPEPSPGPALRTCQCCGKPL